jgi:hypothetical protein
VESCARWGDFGRKNHVPKSGTQARTSPDVAIANWSDATSTKSTHQEVLKMPC